MIDLIIAISLGLILLASLTCFLVSLLASEASPRDRIRGYQIATFGMAVFCLLAVLTELVT